jgi:hypothetical protein
MPQASSPDKNIRAGWFLFAVALAVVGLIVGAFFAVPSSNRYQPRENAPKKVKVTDLLRGPDRPGFWSRLMAPGAGVPSARAQLSWLGNSFKSNTWYKDPAYDGVDVDFSPSSPDYAHVPVGVAACGVGPDGTVYVNNFFDDSNVKAVAFKSDGTWSGRNPTNGVTPGRAWCVTASYVFMAASVLDAPLPGTGDSSHFSVGFTRFLPGKPPGAANVVACNQAAFAPTYPSYFEVERPLRTSYGSDQASFGIPNLYGLAAVETSANTGTLYVSAPHRGAGNAGQIVKYSYSGADVGLVTGFTNFTNPGPLIADRNGLLWVIRRSGNPYSISTVTGNFLTTTDNVITFAAGVKASSLFYDSTTHQLWVFDRGPDHNVKVYDLANLTVTGGHTTVLKTYGVRGGCFSQNQSGGSVLGYTWPPRFTGPLGGGLDGSGNFYFVDAPVADSETTPPMGQQTGTAVLKYAANPAAGAAPVWQLYGNHIGDTADYDPADPGTAYSLLSAYSVDYQNATFGKGWSYLGSTLDALTYPADPRDITQSSGMCVRRFGSPSVLYLYSFWGANQGAAGGNFYYNRQAPSQSGKVFIPSGRMTFDTGTARTLLYDTTQKAFVQKEQWPQDAPYPNSSFDAQGNLYVTYLGGGSTPGKFRKFFVQPVDSFGNPQYLYASSNLYNAPFPFNDGSTGTLGRLFWDPAAQELYLAGWTAAHPGVAGGDWGGPVLCKYSWDGISDPRGLNPLWTVTGLPANPARSEEQVRAVQAAGDYVFVCAGQLFPPGDGSLGGGWLIFAYRRSDGGLATTIDSSTVQGGVPKVGGFSAVGFMDTTHPFNVRQRPSGEYVMFLEDDNGGKVWLVRWTP